MIDTRGMLEGHASSQPHFSALAYSLGEKNHVEADQRNIFSNESLEELLRCN